MSSLDHLLCPDTIERRPSSSFDNMSYSKHHNTLSPDSSARPNSRRCCVPDCQKTAKRGGRCIAHGGGNKCAVDGCTTSVVSRGLCVAHGGGKRCQTPTCAKSAQSGGFCWVHGGGKKCGYHGCSKRAQSGGACIAHGGGKRCRIDGCNKVVQYDGLCVGHGGYRRCVFENCDRRAMANDYCQQHGGSSVCLLERCYKRAVRGGMCSEHKTEVSFQAVTASELSTPSHSSDEDQRRPVGKSATTSTQRASKTEWRDSITSDDLTSKSCSELRAPTSGIARRFQMLEAASSRSPLPAKFVLEDRGENRRGDSSVAPGISALLNADDKFPSFSSYPQKIESAERYQHQEQKVYPLLPRIQALQNYSTGVASIEKSPRLPLKSELRIVVKEDPTRLKQRSNTGVCYQEGEDSAYSDEPTTRKLYVHSYYYRKNDGALPCSTTPSHRYGWGRRYT